MTREEYEACQTRDDQAFKAAIEGITSRALQSGIAKIEYPVIVAEEWRKGGVDAALDKEVDKAVNEVRSETSWTTLLSSPFYKEQAQKLAETVASRVYRSDAMKVAIEQLAAAVSREVGKSLEIATSDAAEPAQACLKAFIGPRYGETVANVVVGAAGKGFLVDPSKNASVVTTGALLDQGKEGIAGAVLIVVRGQLTRMAERIGQRLVGVVLSRLVSIVSGAVGIVLIAKDIWDFRKGVLPIISEEMKSAASKDKVKAELARTIGEQISEHTRDIATATAERILDIWHEFQRAHAHVVRLAESDEGFKHLLDAQKPDSLARFDELVGLIIAKGGDAAVKARVADGSLSRAVNVMPASGMSIARESRSLETALDWWAVAGDKLDKVVDLELFRRAKPPDFTAETLGRIIRIPDKTAALRLAALPHEARDNLFELPDNELAPIARTLSESELVSLSRYLTGLRPAASTRVLRAVVLEPGKMHVLGEAHVRNAILASSDQEAAVAMMLRSDNALDPADVYSDARLALTGKVSPILMWDKHPILVSAAGVAGLWVLFLLRGLFFGRRRPGRSIKA